MNIGSAKDVGLAQLNPMPSSIDTSTMRLPGRKASRSSRRRYVSGAFGSCSVQLTTMSFLDRYSGRATGPSSVFTVLADGEASSCSNCTMSTEGIGELTAAMSRFVSTRTSCTP